MPNSTGWTRDQLLVAFNLYCELPFGRLHSRNPRIIETAKRIGRTPSALAMKLTNVASLDPDITSTGRTGLKGASASDRAMWEEMQADWTQFAAAADRACRSFGVGQTPEPFTPLPNEDDSVDFFGKDRVTETRVRVGQNLFRKAVLSAYNQKCCISGLSVQQLLVASHIVPWRSDPQNRLNPKNGLCLSALHDRAFDTGLITLTDELKVRVCRKDATPDDRFFDASLMAFDGRLISLPEKFEPDREFLRHHRENIFLG